MEKKIEKKLQELKAEFEAGQKMLQNLQAQQEKLETTMIRIHGAIQVLEELLDQKN
ncbi:MAG: hypothetical protein HUU50_07405 [Candidatus Brocadiae bacterium]|nr:hypothetical protein [Candidatus Brocadiia bacterium]